MDLLDLHSDVALRRIGQHTKAVSVGQYETHNDNDNLQRRHAQIRLSPVDFMNKRPFCGSAKGPGLQSKCQVVRA